VFPVAPSNVSNLSGGTAENCPTETVIQLFNNSYKVLGGMNTLPKQDKLPDQTLNMSFQLTNKPKLSDFTIAEYNPFIWVNAPDKGRGYEIHLPGHLPTNSVDKTMFNYADDATSITKTNISYPKTICLGV
jgi:LruC domain-containing protein